MNNSNETRCKTVDPGKSRPLIGPKYSSNTNSSTVSKQKTPKTAESSQTTIAKNASMKSYKGNEESTEYSIIDQSTACKMTMAPAVKSYYYDPKDSDYDNCNDDAFKKDNKLTQSEQRDTYQKKLTSSADDLRQLRATVANARKPSNGCFAYENVSENRQYVSVPLDGNTHHLKFLDINIKVNAAPSPEATAGIAVGYSTNTSDMPPVPDGFSVLHNVVISCIPRVQALTDPVYILIPLSFSQLLDSAAGFYRISLYHSKTNVDESPLWVKFRRISVASSRNIKFVDDSKSDGRSNVALLDVESAEITLKLYHLSMFCVIIDERPENLHKVSVSMFMKLCSGTTTMSIDILILVGGNDKQMAEVEDVAVKNNFEKVYLTHFHMTDIGGDVHVHSNRVEWMTDSSVSEPKSFFHQKLDVWNSVASSTFLVTSAEAVSNSNGVETRFAFDATVVQVGRLPVNVKVSKNLHEMKRELKFLPFCRCSSCSESKKLSRQTIGQDQPVQSIGVTIDPGKRNMADSVVCLLSQDKPLSGANFVPSNVSRTSELFRAMSLINPSMPPPVPPRLPSKRSEVRSQMDNYRICTSNCTINLCRAAEERHQLEVRFT